MTLREALEIIAEWNHPEYSDHYRCSGTIEHMPKCNEDCGLYTFEFEYGSNGIREYFRTIAKRALADSPKETEKSATTSPHAHQEKCIRCNFTYSAHSDGYCPDGLPNARARFTTTVDLRLPDYD